MTPRRFLLLVRLVLGVLLVRQGASGLSDLVHVAQVMQAHSAWQHWPLLGSLRPMELAIWIATLEFAVGIFLLGGLLTRLSALVTALLAVFSLATLADLGLAANLAHAALLLAALLIVIKGGGAGTMDALLGQMQRRSLEREAARKAAERNLST